MTGKNLLVSAGYSLQIKQSDKPNKRFTNSWINEKPKVNS
jgi:hypothetical protein